MFRYLFGNKDKKLSKNLLLNFAVHLFINKNFRCWEPIQKYNFVYSDFIFNWSCFFHNLKKHLCIYMRQSIFFQYGVWMPCCFFIHTFIFKFKFELNSQQKLAANNCIYL